MLLGFLTTADVTMLALGETNSNEPMEAGAASHDATPWRSEEKVKSARLSVLPPISRCSIVRYRTFPISGGRPLLLPLCTLGATICSISAQNSHPAPCW